MYKMSTVTDAEMYQIATAPRPLGPAIDPATVAQADRLEVWATEMRDPGPDYTEFRLLRGRTVVATVLLPG